MVIEMLSLNFWYGIEGLTYKINTLRPSQYETKVKWMRFEFELPVVLVKKYMCVWYPYKGRE